MQAQAASLYAEETEFKRQYANLSVVDLEELIVEFEEGDDYTEWIHALV